VTGTLHRLSGRCVVPAKGMLMPNLHTCFCHKCGKFAEYPYQSSYDGELYHKVCLPDPEVLKFADEEYTKYINNFLDRLNQDTRV
jgi:hypothetical protein